MVKQLHHDPNPLGGPCRRCGIKYTERTAHIPCFVEGDTYGSWLARLPERTRRLANPELAKRRHPEFYIQFTLYMLENGATEAEANAAVEERTREAAALFNGKCPKCGAPSTRYIDKGRQHGVSSIPGVWVMYRCSTQPPPGQKRDSKGCAFMLDLKEMIR